MSVSATGGGVLTGVVLRHAAAQMSPHKTAARRSRYDLSLMALRPAQVISVFVHDFCNRVITDAKPWHGLPHTESLHHGRDQPPFGGRIEALEMRRKIPPSSTQLHR